MAKVLRQRGRYRGEFSERLSHRDYFWEKAQYVGGEQDSAFSRKDP